MAGAHAPAISVFASWMAVTIAGSEIKIGCEHLVAAASRPYLGNPACTLDIHATVRTCTAV